MAIDNIDAEIEQVKNEIQELKNKKEQLEQAEEGEIEKIEEEPAVKKVSVVETPEGEKKGIIALWNDGHTTVCIEGKKEQPDGGICYTTGTEEGNKIFYLAEAWAINLGHKVKPLKGEVAGYFPKE